MSITKSLCLSNSEKDPRSDKRRCQYRRLSVARHEIAKSRIAQVWHPKAYLLVDPCNIHEAYLPLQEGLHGYLVGCIEHTGGIPSPIKRFVRQSETDEAIEVRLLEVQGSAHEVVPLYGHILSYATMQCKADRQPHVGSSELSLDSSIAILHHRMHDALRVYQYRDLIRRNGEEVACLHHLQPFVHHRSGVDRYLAAHLPPRMIECLCYGYLLQLFDRGLPKGASARCEVYTLYGATFA